MSSTSSSKATTAASWWTLTATAVLLVAALTPDGYAAAAGATSVVYIRSKFGQPLTSSTLYWVHVDIESSAWIPNDSVEVTYEMSDHDDSDEVAKNSYVCRAQHRSLSVLGSTFGEREGCNIAYYGVGVNIKKFEVFFLFGPVSFRLFFSYLKTIYLVTRRFFCEFFPWRNLASIDYTICL